MHSEWNPQEYIIRYGAIKDVLLTNLFDILCYNFPVESLRPQELKICEMPLCNLYIWNLSVVALFWVAMINVYHKLINSFYDIENSSCCCYFVTLYWRTDLPIQIMSHKYAEGKSSSLCSSTIHRMTVKQLEIFSKYENISNYENK